jgi:hypothetical protein
MSHQRSIKKKLMKGATQRQDTKKVTHFFRGKKLYATRVDSEIGSYSFKRAPGRVAAKKKKKRKSKRASSSS